MWVFHMGFCHLFVKFLPLCLFLSHLRRTTSTLFFRELGTIAKFQLTSKGLLLETWMRENGVGVVLDLFMTSYGQPEWRAW